MLMQDAHDWLRETASKMQEDIEKGAAPEAEKLTVRQFLEKFGYARREDGLQAIFETRWRSTTFGPNQTLSTHT